MGNPNDPGDVLQDSCFVSLALSVVIMTVSCLGMVLTLYGLWR